MYACESVSKLTFTRAYCEYQHYFFWPANIYLGLSIAGKTIALPRSGGSQPFASVSRVKFRDFFCPWLPAVENVQNWLTRASAALHPR